jgi:hypothetical protein
MLLDKLNPLILLLTLVAIIWYAWETRGMKKQMIEQKDLSMRPFIFLKYHMFHYRLRNIGYGPAINIKMDNIAVTQIDERLTIKYSFTAVDVLAPGETADLEICYENGNPAIASDQAAIMPKTAAKSFDFKIRYHNLENKEYSISGKLGKDGISQQRPDQTI